MALRCPACGARSRTGDARCHYCQARPATISCPSCFALLFDGSAYCPHYSAAQNRGEPMEARQARCPACRGSMRWITVGDLDLMRFAPRRCSQSCGRSRHATIRCSRVLLQSSAARRHPPPNRSRSATKDDGYNTRELTILAVSVLVAGLVVVVRQANDLPASGWTVLGPLFAFRFLYDLRGALPREQPAPGRGLRLNSALAAKLYGALVLVVVAFQLALAAGAPWGSLALGGAFPGQLPPAMRVAAVVQALVLLVFAAIVTARGGVFLPGWSAAAGRLIWLVVGLSVVSVVLNAITPSTWGAGDAASRLARPAGLRGGGRKRTRHAPPLVAGVRQRLSMFTSAGTARRAARGRTCIASGRSRTSAAPA